MQQPFSVGAVDGVEELTHSPATRGRPQPSPEPASVAHSEILRIPRHVAIVMDGNGRWAQQRGLPRMAGHRAGTENIRRIIESFADHKVEVLTLYAFSTENWTRPRDEVDNLMDILADVIDRETQALHEKGARICHLGRLDGLRPELQEKVRAALHLTRNNRRITVNIAFNYGGRSEIIDAVRRILADGLSPDDLDEATLSRYLYTGEQPDPDLIIRTAGDKRLSNFLIWQAAYSEYHFTPTYWPDFSEDHVAEAIREYSRRQRRFGGVANH